MPVTIKASNLKYKDTNGEYVGVNSISDMTTAEQLAAIDQAGTTNKNAIDTAGANHLSAINTAGTNHLSAINTAGATQTTAVNNAGATQVAAVNSAGTTQVTAVQDKGDEVLESIPSDYSELTEDVNSLMSAIDDAPSEETGLDLLALEQRKTEVLGIVLDEMDTLIQNLPSDEMALEIRDKLVDTNGWLDMIYNEMVLREAV